MKFVIIFVIIFVITGCGSYISKYSFTCEETNTSVNQLADENTSAKTLRIKDEIYARYRYLFEDEHIKIHLDCEPNRLGVYIINKTNFPVKINGDSIKVYSEHLRDTTLLFSNSNKDSIILGNETWMNEIELKKDLLPYKSGNKELLYEKAKVALGNKINLSIPINLENNKTIYNFSFTPKDFKILSK